MARMNVGDCLKRFARDDNGATAIEYALIAGGISAVIISIVYALGQSVFGQYEAVSDAYKSL